MTVKTGTIPHSHATYKAQSGLDSGRWCVMLSVHPVQNLTNSFTFSSFIVIQNDFSSEKNVKMKEMIEKKVAVESSFH